MLEMKFLLNIVEVEEFVDKVEGGCSSGVKII